MPKSVKTLLSIIVPLGIGAWLVYYSLFLNMSQEDRKGMWNFITEANFIWPAISIVLGWLSHLSRAERWRLKLEAINIRPKFWNAYHAVMAGYIINLTIPRSGEASRAAILSRKEGKSFSEIFGTILVERAIDVIMLGIVFLLFLLFGIQEAEELQQFVAKHTGQSVADDGGLPWFKIIFGTGVVLVAVLAIAVKKIREKVLELLSKIWSGISSILKMKKKGMYIAHTVFIWLMYVGMFWVVFLAFEETKAMPIGGILAGFIAGTIGIIFIPGGVGAYWILVGLVVTYYLFPDATEIPNNKAVGVGMLIWITQNLLIILAGVISLAYAGKKSLAVPAEENS